MRKLTSPLLLIAALFCGCASEHFNTGHGDVGQFILQQAIARGGSPATNALPLISGRWRYSEDKDGVVIRMSREQYPRVEAFLRQAFGSPSLGPTKTIDGGKLGAYRLSSKGGGLQFVQNAMRTQIIVIRPMSTQETLSNIMRAEQEMEKKR